MLMWTKTLFLILCSLCIVSTTHAFDEWIVIGQPVPSAGACTLTDTCGDGVPNTWMQISKANSGRWYAGLFTADSTGDICQIDLFLRRNGTGGADYGVYIFTDNGGADPDNVPTTDGSLGGNTYDVSGVAVDPGEWVSFTGLSIAVTNGVKYWVVFGRSPRDPTNWLDWGREADENCDAEHDGMAAEGDTNMPPQSAWSDASDNASLSMKIYIQ